uniref:Ribosomal biosis factor n=1 Tax=Chinchilla lanigera TaxID=34839 RepID=A0A8C2VU94_CHILA
MLRAGLPTGVGPCPRGGASSCFWRLVLRKTVGPWAGLHQVDGVPLLGTETMAKNKLRGQKSKNVFHIASQKHFKSKNKAKPVTTNLKKINIVNEEKIRRMNKAFINIQKELAHFSKMLTLEPLQKELIKQRQHENEPVNVDEATRLMAQL